MSTNVQVQANMQVWNCMLAFRRAMMPSKHPQMMLRWAAPPRAVRVPRQIEPEVGRQRISSPGSVSMRICSVSLSETQSLRFSSISKQE